MKDFKNAIQPLQDWLLSHGKCVTCGRELMLQKRKRLNGHFLVSCACKKNFLYDPKRLTFERLHSKDVQFFLE